MYNRDKANQAGQVSIHLKGFSNEESARNCLQSTLKPGLAKQITEVLGTKGLSDGGVFESNLMISNHLNPEESQMPDQTLRNTILRGLITKQIAITNGVQLTNRASASYISELSPALHDSVFLHPEISSATLGLGQVFVDNKYIPTVSELLKRMAAANKTIDGKYNEVRSFLGNPIADLELGAKDGFFRRYEKGAIYVSPTGTAHEVHGAIYQKYLALRAEAGFLGFPETDEQSTSLGTGRFNHFQGGSIYWTESTGAWEIHGAIRINWWELGGDRSDLGYPISDEENWTNPSNNSAGRISHFQRGSIVYRFTDSSVQANYDAVILTTSLSSSSVTCSAELWMNSAGDWVYKGHMHNSGFFGFNVVVVSTPRFQDANGNIFAPNVERHVGGTTSGDDRSDDWSQVGSGEPFIRDNWDSIRSAGLKTVMDVDVTLGDIVQLIGAGLPIAVGVVIAGAILLGGKVCGPYGSIKRDPYTKEDRSSIGFDVVGKDEQCRQ